ncbi:recombinase family protein [Kineococcus arenarius]|uniref:recombinase family protein n=1 Tax=unclassified Kineococcus TaxID=2621656 RepID=UPI003D7CF1CC
MQESGPVRAILYLRQSAGHEESISTVTQLEHAAAHARRRGYEVVDVVIDTAASGRSFTGRSIGRIIEEVTAGTASVVVVWKWSRWGRDLVESLLHLAELERAGGRLESATEPGDAAPTTGGFSRNDMLALAQHESERIGDSWKDAKRHMVLRRGLPPVGGARLGYTYEAGRRTYCIDPVAGPALRSAYERYVAGSSMHALTLWMRTLGVVTTRGNPMSEGSLKASMDSGFAAGLIRLNEPEKLLNDDELAAHGVVPGEALFLPGVHRHEGVLTRSWEPLIDVQLFHSYRNARSRRSATRPSAPNPRQALTGLVRCAGCRRVMGFRPDRNRWVCTNSTTKAGAPCPVRVTLDGDEALDLTRNWLDSQLATTSALEALMRRRLERASAIASIESITRSLERHERRVADLHALAAEGQIPPGALAPEVQEALTRVKRTRTALSQAQQRVREAGIPDTERFRTLRESLERGDATVNSNLQPLISAVWAYPFRDDPRVIVQERWESDERIPRARKPDTDFSEGRTCLRCRTWKPAEQFYRRRRGRTLLAQCIPCRADMARERKERIAAGA